MIPLQKAVSLSATGAFSHCQRRGSQRHQYGPVNPGMYTITATQTSDCDARAVDHNLLTIEGVYTYTM